MPAQVGIVAGGRRYLYSTARVDGFRAAAKAAAPGEAVISVASGNWDPGQAEAATHSLFERGPAITAVFTCSDAMALGVYDALAARGLRVPMDVSVVGCQATARDRGHPGLNVAGIGGQVVSSANTFAQVRPLKATDAVAASPLRCENVSGIGQEH